MNKEYDLGKADGKFDKLYKLTPLEALQDLSRLVFIYGGMEQYKIIETALKDYENLKEENKLLRENNENLDENYYDTWYACERLKENSNYALMFIDNIYCLVDTKDNKFDVIDNYKINNYGIIDNGTQTKLKALEIIKDKEMLSVHKDYKGVCYLSFNTTAIEIPQEEYEILNEVLKDE